MKTGKNPAGKPAEEFIDWPVAAMILSFLIPFAVMYLLFVFNRIYPFGDRSYLYSDMYHQYMPFFSEFMRKVKEGEGLAYSFNVGIGSNFLALYAYYLASPLNWLAFLFPQKYLMEFMSYLVIVKISLCGLTSYLYLKGHGAGKDYSALLFSSFYALSGYMAAYSWNLMWLDCIVLLPLIVLGLERLVKEGRCMLYCVTLSLSVLSNYYISIMICLFLVLYFLLLLITDKRSFRIAGRFILYSVLAGGMAAVLLLPAGFALLGTEGGTSEFPDTIKFYFSAADMLARHCINVAPERGLEHWPNIYCGAGVFLLMPLYVFNRKIAVKKRLANLALAALLLLSFSFNILDYFWHGMKFPHSLPARQSFIYILLVLTMCFEAYQKSKEMKVRYILMGSLSAAGFLGICRGFGKINTEELVLTLGFVAAYALLLCLNRLDREKKMKEGIAAAAFILVAAEAGINSWNTTTDTTGRSQYLDQQEEEFSLTAAVRQKSLTEQEETSGPELAGDGGPPFFRIEKFRRNTKNDSALAGYPGASLFSSTVNYRVVHLYERFGMRDGTSVYCFDGATAFTSALLNVSYMLGDDNNEENSLYSLVDNSGSTYLYQCLRTLPFGYVAPAGYDLAEDEGITGLELQNQMVNDLGAEGSLFSKVSCIQADSQVTAEAVEGGIYYCVITAADVKEVWGGGERQSRRFTGLKEGSVCYLGELEAGEQVKITTSGTGTDTEGLFAEIYFMEEAVLEDALNILSENELVHVSYDSTSISGDIDLQEEGRLILSIPYDYGLTAVVDGKEVEPELFGGALVSFELEPGHHEISLSYTPPGKAAGIAVSIISIGILGMIMGRKGVRHKKGVWHKKDVRHKKGVRI